MLPAMSDAHSPRRTRQGFLTVDTQGRIRAPMRSDVFAEAMVDMVRGPRQLTLPSSATPTQRAWNRTGQALFKVMREPKK